MFNIAAAIYPRASMFFSTLPSTIAGQAILLVGLYRCRAGVFRHSAPAPDREKSPVVERDRQHVARPVHVRRTRPHRPVQSTLHRHVQAVAADRADGLSPAYTYAAPQGHRSVYRRHRGLHPEYPGKLSQRPKNAFLRASKRWPHHAGHERTAVDRRLGFHPRRRHRTAPRRAGTRRDPRPGAAPRGRRRGDHHVPAAGGEATLQRERQRDRDALDREHVARLVRPDLAARRKCRAGVQ